MYPTTTTTTTKHIACIYILILLGELITCSLCFRFCDKPFFFLKLEHRSTKDSLFEVLAHF